MLHDLFPALSWRSAISSADHLSLSANPNRSAKAERPRRICRRDHDKCGLENVPVSWESHPAGLSYPAISARPLISSAAEAMERNPEEVLEAPTRAAARASGSQRIVWSARSPLCVASHFERSIHPGLDGWSNPFPAQMAARSLQPLLRDSKGIQGLLSWSAAIPFPAALESLRPQDDLPAAVESFRASAVVPTKICFERPVVQRL